MVLYLKYLVRSGHLFILEEPESHLDPTNQRFLARAIAMLVNAGVRVLVTTHSDIVLGQLNNLMQVSGFQARRRLRMGYKSAEVLSPSDVSAYVFQPNADGSRVHGLSVDSEEGISTESFDSVHRALYDESIRMEHARQLPCMCRRRCLDPSAVHAAKATATRGRDPTRALRSRLVELRGQKRRIIPLKCGSRLR